MSSLSNIPGNINLFPRGLVARNFKKRWSPLTPMAANEQVQILQSGTADKNCAPTPDIEGFESFLAKPQLPEKALVLANRTEIARAYPMIMIISGSKSVSIRESYYVNFKPSWALDTAGVPTPPSECDIPSEDWTAQAPVAGVLVWAMDTTTPGIITKLGPGELPVLGWFIRITWTAADTGNNLSVGTSAGSGTEILQFQPVDDECMSSTVFIPAHTDAFSTVDGKTVLTNNPQSGAVDFTFTVRTGLTPTGANGGWQIDVRPLVLRSRFV